MIATSPLRRGPVPRAALVRTKNACSGVVPTSALGLLQTRQEDPHLPLEIGRERVGARAAREHPPRVALDRAQHERREPRDALALPQRATVAGPAKLHIAGSAAPPGCVRTNAFAPARLSTSACVGSTSTTRHELAFSACRPAAAYAIRPLESQRASSPATTPLAGIPCDSGPGRRAAARAGST